MMTNTALAPLLERFFMQRLMQQRQVSPHTISSYRDTFRMFLKFAQQRLHKPPSKLNFEQIDAPLIVAFLDDLEKQRRLIDGTALPWKREGIPAVRGPQQGSAFG